MQRFPQKTPVVSFTKSLILAFALSCLATPALADNGLQSFDAQAQSLKKYTGNGKWLVVMLWASDCHVCNQEAQQYVNFHKKHANKDATLLGISLDGAAKQKEAEAFLQRHKLNFPNLIAEAGDIAQMYQELTGSPWIGTPSFMVYTPAGELLGAQAGAVPPTVIEGFIERESKTQQGS